MPRRNRIQKAALAITHWIGSPVSIVIHTLLFLICFAAAWNGYIALNQMLLILTTIVSLEAIYLSIFIQMTINYTTEAVEDVAEDVEEMSEEDNAGEAQEAEQKKTLTDIQNDLRKLMQDIEKLQQK